MNVGASRPPGNDTEESRPGEEPDDEQLAASCQAWAEGSAADTLEPTEKSWVPQQNASPSTKINLLLAKTAGSTASPGKRQKSAGASPKKAAPKRAKQAAGNAQGGTMADTLKAGLLQ